MYQHLQSHQYPLPSLLEILECRQYLPEYRQHLPDEEKPTESDTAMINEFYHQMDMNAEDGGKLEEPASK